MKTNSSQFRRAAQMFLRISLLILVCLQVSVMSAHATKQIFVEWGTNWSDDNNGVGGTVSTDNHTVQLNQNASPKFGNTETVAFHVTPDPGFLIGSVWRTDQWGNWHQINSPNSNGDYEITVPGQDCIFDVYFKPDPNAAAHTITAYYGTNTFDFTAANKPNWNGGTVTVNTSSNNYTAVGTSAYKVYDYGDNAVTKKFKVTPNTSPDFTVTSVKYSEAAWHTPDSITQTGATWTTLSPDSNGFYYLPCDGYTSYVIFVTFTPVGATGGYIGAWYGTNNTTAYDTPQANGTGGTVWKTSPSPTEQLNNRIANGVHVTSNATVTFEVRPATNFKITSIMYGGNSPTSSVTVPANQTTNMTFSFPVSGGNTYIIWVVFTSTAATSYTVNGTVDAATDPLCTSNTITPSTTTVNNPNTGTSFVLATSTNCVIDCVNFDAVGCAATGISGSTYTTPAITHDTNFQVRFKPIGFKIDAVVDASSPSGCGAISPAGAIATGNAIDVPMAGSKTFTITTNTGCSIAHVYVTDTNKVWTNHDLVPMSGNTYTFSNIQANGSITVYFVPSVPASGYDYCQIPPFVQGRSDLIPNVLVLFDNSGSMGGTDLDGYAYYNRTGQTYSCDNTRNGFTGDTPTPTKPCNTKFYGYFDTNKMYKTQTSPSNANVYLIDNVTLNLSSSNAMSGNYLNYRNMNKVDVIRKVLVGGRITDKNSSTLNRTVADKFLYTDNGKWVEYGANEPTGLIQEYSDRVRFGLEVFGSTSNSSSDGGTIVATLGSPIATIVAAIEGPKTNPNTNTPIAEALYEAIRYYQAKPSAYNSNTNYGDSTWNPTTNPVIQYPCQKHFVLMLTDGEANSTDKLPGLTNPTLNGYTDGVFNVNTWKGRIAAGDLPTTSDGQYSAAVAYYGHATDLRSTDYNNDIAGTQNITFYTVYAFGDKTNDGPKTLKALSKYGGFESKNGNDAGTDPNKYPSPDMAAEWDFNGDGIPDTYFEGDDGDVIGAKLIEALKNIIAKVASGTAASILANSEGSGANLLQAIFYPNKLFDAQTEANWTGELHNLWYFIDPTVTNSTVREDTEYVSGDTHYLHLKTDYVVDYYFDGTKTAVNLSQDTDGNGSGDVSISTGLDPEAVKSIWRAGRSLWTRAASDRKIYTACSIKSGACAACLGTGGCPSGSTNSRMMEFVSSAANNTIFKPYLQAADDSTSGTIINYIRGVDQTNYRNRTVTRNTAPTGTNVWKLGDIISSTPRIESNMKLNTYNLTGSYSDISYGNDKGKTGFIYSPGYLNRGMVFAGANDGMLHAFNLGILDVTASGDKKASLTGTDLGKEAWAFIPSSALPYLKYTGDPAYGDKFHLNFIDGVTIVTDASIGITVADTAHGVPACTETTDYWKCARDTVNGSNWRTIVIGSMGTGGASRKKGDATCGTNCVNTPIFDPNDGTKGFGYSSYFALDVTDPTAPTLLWEFSDPTMGFATSGPAIVRLATRTGTGAVDATKNGRWFAVFASGPTGPIALQQFHGRSNQPLKLFIVDLKTGALQATIGTLADGSTLDNAFSGAIFNNVIDTDRGVSASAGFYQDDAVYIGYAQANGLVTDAATTWTNGGLLRLLTGENLNADGTINTTTGWKLSKVIDGIGPVVSNIGKIIDRKNSNFWIYFGTGRYYDSGDDKTGQQRIIGLKEPCYKAVATHLVGPNTTNDIDDNGCTTKLTLSNLDDQTNSPTTVLNAVTNSGWYINLDPQAGTLDAERVLTDPVTTLSGVIFFTSFKPTSDVCSFGGETNIWATAYDSGAAPPAGRLNGKALLQLSTGSFTEVDMATAFGAKDGRRTSASLVGKPPGDAMPVVSNSQNRPVKKLIHIREK